MCESYNIYDKTKKDIRNTHINISTGVCISIKELAELIKKIIDFKGPLNFNTDKSNGLMYKWYLNYKENK